MIDDTETQSRNASDMTENERADLFEYLNEAYEITQHLTPSTLMAYMKGKIMQWFEDYDVQDGQPDEFAPVTNAEANDLFTQWVSLVERTEMKKVV